MKVYLKRYTKKNDRLPCFIKIDIETSEYRILDELIENQEKFTGIAIEFHDVDLHLDKILKFITSLNMTLAHSSDKSSFNSKWYANSN